MIGRILVAVDDSPDSLDAVRVAIELTTGLGAQLRAVHLRPDHSLDRELEAAASGSAVALRREQAATAILARISIHALTAGVVIQTEVLAGEIAPAILEAARDWPADLVVIGKSRRGSTAGCNSSLRAYGLAGSAWGDQRSSTDSGPAAIVNARAMTVVVTSEPTALGTTTLT